MQTIRYAMRFAIHFFFVRLRERKWSRGMISSARYQPASWWFRGLSHDCQSTSFLLGSLNAAVACFLFLFLFTLFPFSMVLASRKFVPVSLTFDQYFLPCNAGLLFSHAFSLSHLQSVAPNFLPHTSEHSNLHLNSPAHIYTSITNIFHGL